MVLGCARTSLLLKVGGVVIFITFLLHVIGFASPFWSQRSNGNEGLWEICHAGECIAPSDSPILKDESWFKAVRVCESFGLVHAVVAIIMLLILLFNAKLSSHLNILICAVVFSYLTAVFVLIGLVTYATRGSIALEAAFESAFIPGFAFYLIVLVTVGWLVAGIILSCDLDQKLEEARQKKEKENGHEPATIIVAVAADTPPPS